MVSVNAYMLFICFAILLLNIYVHFYKKEENPTFNEYSKISDVLILLKNFFKNSNLRLICALLFLFRLGFTPVDAGNLNNFYIF